MRPPKYPLDPLARLREKQVDDASRAHAATAKSKLQAQAERAAAERQHDEHEARANEAREHEAASLAKGELTAADLMRQDAWEHRVRREERELAQGVEAARAKEKDASAIEASARRDTAARKADAEVVAKDQARWQKRETDRAEAREEEAAEDAWAAKKR
jgi:hypothetical protein